MELWLLGLAGVAAGAINSAVGSGTLLTYPLLLAYGLPPVVANATNTVGVAPGGLSGAWSYRSHLRGRGRELLPYLVLIGLGSVVGTWLVLALPAQVFATLVPWLIVAACALVLLQQPLLRGLRRWRGEHPIRRRWLVPVLLVVGCYVGYFGAATGIILIAVLGLLYDSDLQHSNAAKNLLTGSANLVAAAVFALSGVVSWPAAITVAAGATVGGLLGAPFAQRLPAAWLRILVVITGLVAAVVSATRIGA